MCASLWLRARGDRNHAHSSLRALYIVARSASEFRLAFVHVHCTELCRFCHRRSSLFSALLCSRLGSALVAAAPQSRLCSALLCSRLGSALICAAPPSLLCFRLFSAIASASSRLLLVAFDFNNTILYDRVINTVLLSKEFALYIRLPKLSKFVC